MKTSKYQNRYISLKDWGAARFTNISLSCRFAILFAASCILGICVENNAVYSANHIINGYFSSFSCNNAIEFIKSACISSSFEFFVLLAAIGSALTFFCSAFLHFSCVICGSVYGICVGAITNTNVPEKNALIWLYIFSVIAFAIIYSVGASLILSANKQFILEKHKNASFSKIFISPTLKKYLIGCFKIITSFAIARILYVGALYIVQIK